MKFYNPLSIDNKCYLKQLKIERRANAKKANTPPFPHEARLIIVGARTTCKYALNLPCIHICLATYYLFAFSHMAFKSSRVHFTRRDFLGSSFLIVVFFWLQIRRKLRQLHNYIHHKPLNQPYTMHHSTRVSQLSGDVSQLSEDVSQLSEDVSQLSGDVSQLSGNVSQLSSWGVSGLLASPPQKQRIPS